MSKINKTPIETRLAIERRSAAMLPDRPTQAGFKPWDIRNALFSAIIADKGACIMGEIDRIVDETNAAIDAMQEKVTTAGTVTIPAEEWSGAGSHYALVRLGDNPISKGCVVLLAPEDNATKEAARAARMSVYNVLDSENSYGDFVMVVRAESGIIPTIPLNFRFVVIKTDTKDKAIAAMVGVDAYGEGGGSGVDETAVKKIIDSMLGKVDNVRQYSADNPPPYPVTSVNGKTDAVELTASDVEADDAGTAKTLTDTLADSIANDLKNYYNKSQTYSRAEIDDKVSTIPKFAVKVVTSLPTSGISETTVYLVPDTTEGGGMYTEYIRVNGAWEELGSQKLDLSGYVTDDELEEAVNDALTTAKESGDFDGRRGYAILRVTSSTTSSSGTGDTGAAIKYKIALSAVLSEAGVDEVLVGDTVLRASVYLYPVIKVDASYVYLGAYTSIKGNPGTSVTITSVTESDESGGINEVVFSDGKSLSVKNGKTPSNIADLEAAEYIEVIGEDSAGVQYRFKFLGQEVTT